MRSGCEGGGKGALIGDEMSNTLATGNDQTLVHYGIGNGQADSAMNMQEELPQTLHCMHDPNAVMCVDKHMCSGIDRVPALEREGAHNVVVSQYGDIAGAVTARNDSSPCADRGPTVIAVENHAQDSRLKETGGLAPTIPSKAGTGGNNVPLCYSISENVIDRKPQNGGHHLGVSDGPCFTLDTAGVHGVASINCQGGSNIGIGTDTTETVTAAANSSGNNLFAVQSVGFVRRLTTVECARLQGFPDHHTEIPWRGKAASDCPRGPQYKAYGNSMCTNVIEWLGRAIEKELNNANSTSKMA